MDGEGGTAVKRSKQEAGSRKQEAGNRKQGRNEAVKS
jgi:hypothetical protein